MKKYLIIFDGEFPDYTDVQVVEVEVDNADELRGEIELKGEEISERRGVVYFCSGVEEAEEDE